MADCMTFPKTADEFIEQYSFKDDKQEYTNGSELIPVFRVKQMMEHYFPVEVVHGRWEKAEYNGFLRCDQCKDVYINEEWLEDGKWNYCPNCGAKMDLKGETT